MTTPTRTATDIRIKDDGTYVASVDSRDFGNIKEGSNLMPLVQKALDEGAVPGPYVGPGDSWIERRIEGYGPIPDQLDMIYWDKVNDTNTFRDHIASVKEDIPKEG